MALHPVGGVAGRPVVQLAVLPVLLATTVGVIAFVAGLFLHEVPPHGFAVVPMTLAPSAAAVAAALLASLARSEADPSLRWAAAGLLVAAVAMTLQLIALPAVAPGGGIFGVVRQGSLLYYLFHLALLGGVTATALSARPRWVIPVSAAGIGLAFVLAQPSLAPAHPILLTVGGDFTPAAFALLAATAVVSALVAAVWVWRSGPHPSATRTWILTAVVLSAYEAVVNAAGGERYSALWWSGVGLRAGTFVVLTGGLLWVTARQAVVSESAVSDGGDVGRGVHTWGDATNRLLATARLLADATSRNGVANALVLVCRRLLGIPGIAVVRLSSGAAPALHADGVPADEIPAEIDLLLSEAAQRPGLASRLLHPAPIFLTGTSEIAALDAGLARAGLRTLAVVPLPAGDPGVTAIVAVSRARRPFSTLERELLIALAQQGAQALRRATAEAEQRATAQTLERLNADLRQRVTALVETAPDAIVTVDLDGVVLAVNSHTLETFGYDADELVGQPVDVLLPERLRDRHARHRGSYAAAPTLRPMGVGLALHARRRDGSEFPVEISLAPMRSDDRNLILATVRDMTEARRVEGDLREAVQRFTAAFEHAPVGMALVGLDGRLVRVNRAMATMLGRPAQELTGRTLSEITDPRDVGSGRDQLADVLVGRIRRYHYEARLLDSTGSPVWTQISVSAIRDQSGTASHLICHVEDLSDRKHYEGQLLYLADHDPLTGLYNRRRFDQELVRHLSEHARSGGAGVLLILDLDNFKYVNDTLGHSVGDALIRTVAAALRHRLRESDVLARLGGDEFGILLPTQDRAGARRVADALVRAVRADGIVSRGGQRARTTVSVGLMPLPGAGGEAADEVVAAADLAMYAAKEQGGDRVEIYDVAGPHLARTEARLRWLERVRQALDNDLFVLVAQPIIDLTTGKVTHQELLLRMRDRDQLLPPELFLEIAQRHGLGRAIDRWVITAAIEIASGSTAVRPADRIDVNLSADSLGDPDLPAFIADELRRRGVDPHRLVFEVTETAAIENMDVARNFVDRICALGCGFALDDFGAGFGSFYYLKYLPFDYLKIDGEFIRQLPESPADRLIVTSIITAAHGLGKRTIAEYVTDAETVELLRELGVDYAQGYHIGRPQPLPPSAVSAIPSQGRVTRTTAPER